MTKMLSLDTATVKSGWAIWLNGTLTNHGVINVSGVKDHTASLDEMVRQLIRLLKDTDPDIVVVEMTVVPTNTGTQRLLSEIVGVVRGWCGSQDPIRDFYRLRPSEWRRLIRDPNDRVPKSKKDGLKEWDIKKAKEIFGFDPVDDNEADAVLIGEAYKSLFERDL